MAERPRWARWVTRISLAAALVALVYTIHDTGLRTIGSYFRRIGWWWFAVAALEIVITTLDAVAIRAFMSPEQGSVKLRQAVLAQLAGRAVNAVTPTGNLGEAIKISVLTEHVSQSRAVATILLYNAVSFSVELGLVAVAAPIMVLFVPMADWLRWVMLGSAGICAILAIGIYVLVRGGLLTRFGRVILSKATYAKWEPRLASVDDKVKYVTHARRRDRWSGLGAVILSRLTSMGLSLMILHSVGESITLGFVAGYTVGGFSVYMLSSLVPMGVGVSEGGYYKLFKALGENPARGVTLVLARRVTLIMYAAIGVVLVTANETVKRARDKHRAPAVELALDPVLPEAVASIVSRPIADAE